MRLSFIVILAGAGLLAVSPSVSAQYSSPNQLLLALQPRAGSFLGVRLTDIDSNRAKALNLGEVRGVEVVHVEEGAPAEEAGIKPGDVLLSYNGETIVGAQQLGRLVAETPVGRKIKLTYWRDGKPQSAFVVTGSPHANPWNFPNTQLPDLPNFTIVDVPDPMLIWKNSALGIACESLDSQLAQYFGVKQGVLVRSVEEGSPAGKAGLRAGDVITAIGDRAVANPREVSSYLRAERHRPLKLASVEVTRERKPISLKIVLPEGLE
jgi:serine protease Do